MAGGGVVRSTTSRFQSALQTGHKVATRLEVLTNGTAVHTITSGVDGTVTLDINAAVRGRFDLTVIDDGTLGLVPNDRSSLLAPYGNEIKISRGIEFPDGTSELVSLGVFRIDRVDVEDNGNSGMTIKVSGQDRAVRIADARFEDPYQVAAGTNVNTAIQNVVSAVFPAATFALAASSATTPLVTAKEQDDRWKFAQDLAASIGCVLFFDGDGVCRSQPVSQLGQTAPAAQLVEGEGGLLLSAAASWVRQGAYNAVIATGENTGNGVPVRGVARDLDPLSATYYYGPFGQVPRWYSSPFLTTAAQAVDAAAGILARELGGTRQVSFGTVCNPALEPNDVVRITRQAAGLDEDHVIDQITIPLSAEGAITGRTRAVTA